MIVNKLSKNRQSPINIKQRFREIDFILVVTPGIMVFEI